MYWIWIKAYHNGEWCMNMRSTRAYERKGNAERAAKIWWSDTETMHYEITVSETNPFTEEQL